MPTDDTDRYGFEGELTLSRILALAEQLAWVRPLGQYPNWRFDADWNSEEFGLRLRRMIWEYCQDRQLQEQIVIDWYYGLRLHLYLSNDTSKQLFVAGCFEPNEFAFLDEILEEGMTFVDAGANEGLYTLLASARTGPEGRVLAFEPSRREFDRLQANLDLNSLRNVRTFPVALGNAKGQADLLVAEDAHAGHNTFGQFAYDTKMLRRDRVTVESLDSLVREAGLERLDVMKIDVEGGEVALLQGAEQVLRSFRPVLLIEVNDAALRNLGSGQAHLINQLLLHDYELFAFDRRTGKPRLAAPEECCDNIVAAPRGSAITARLLAADNLAEQLRSTAGELNEARTQLERLKSVENQLQEAREQIRGMKSTKLWRLRMMFHRLFLLSRSE